MRSNDAGLIIAGIVAIVVFFFFATLWAMNTMSQAFEGPTFYWYHVIAFWVLASAFHSRTGNKSR